MKNKTLYQIKKAIIVTLLAVMCFFIPATSIAADDNIEVTAVGNLSTDNPYEVTIPVSVSVDSSTKKASFKVTGDIYKNQKFLMSVSSKNNYKLTAGSENLSYSLDKTSFNYTTSSSLDSFEDTVNVTVSGTTKTAGSFSDTLTFTIKCETNSAAVTFDNNDGSGTITTLNIAPGSTFGTLPTPTRTDYKFNGWYYLDSNNNKCYITSTDTYSGAVTTFYADWISLKPVLQYGYDFNNNIPDTATSVNFANYRAVPDSVTTTDVSANQDGSILAWMEGTTMYVSPKYEGATIMANSNCTSMFAKKRNLASIELNNFNTSKVAKMNSMFYNCSSLTTLDVSNFDTSNVTKMNGMFSDCSKLTSLDLSNFDTSNVTDMSSMFLYCSSLTDLDISKFNTSKVTTMQSMFYNCEKITDLDVSNFNTSNVTNMTTVFSGCKALTSLDVSNFNTSKVTTMQGMFYNCEKITDLDVSNFNTSNVTNMTTVFSGCKALTSLDVSNFNTSKVTTMESMFYNCSSLTSLDLSNFDTSNVTKMKSMFNSCSKLTSLDVSKFNTSNVTDMSFMFLYCNSLTALDVSNFNTSKVTTMEDMFYDCRKVTDLNVSSFDTSNVTNMSMMFGSCKALTSLDVSNFNTSKVTTMKSMFYNCDALTSLDVSYFNTSKVTTMENMFLGCDKLKNISLGSDFNTSNVTNMANMFAYCEVLEALDLSNFDTSKVTTMKGMFDYCNALTSLDLSNFNTSNVTNMYRMFYACLNLATLNVSSFDTSNVTNMGAMFGACEKLTSLNISNFNTEKVTNMYGLFYGDRTLTSLDLSSFNTSSLDMSDTKNYDLFFYACDSLNTISVGTGWVQAIDFPDSGVASAGKWYALSSGTEYTYNAIPIGKADTYSVIKPNFWVEDGTAIVSVASLIKTYSNADFTLNNDSAIEIASIVDEASEEAMPCYHLNNDEDLNSSLAMNVTSISINGVMASENAKYDDTRFVLEQSEDGILTITSIMDDGYPSLDDWKALIYSDIFTDVNENVTISISVVNLTQDTEISDFAFVEDTEKETDSAVSSVPSDDSGVVSWDSTGEIVILEQVEAKSEEGAETTAPTEDVAKEELPALDTQETSKQSETQDEQEIVN